MYMYVYMDVWLFRASVVTSSIIFNPPNVFSCCLYHGQSADYCGTMCISCYLMIATKTTFDGKTRRAWFSG